MAAKKTGTTGKRKFLKHLEMPPVGDAYRGSDKLKGKIALITGGDSGIGRAVAVHFAREGADVAIVYRESDDDASETKAMVEAEGTKCITIKMDVSSEANCKKIIERVKKEFGDLHVLINNAGMHIDEAEIEGISSAQLKKTFEVISSLSSTSPKLPCL